MTLPYTREPRMFQPKPVEPENEVLRGTQQPRRGRPARHIYSTVQGPPEVKLRRWIPDTRGWPRGAARVLARLTWWGFLMWLGWFLGGLLMSEAPRP